MWIELNITQKTKKVLKSLLWTFLLFCIFNSISLTYANDPAQANKYCSTEGYENRDPQTTVGTCTPPKACDEPDCIDAAPADGINRVSGVVGHRDQNYSNGQATGSTDHKGTDYAAAKGSPVYAAADGVVRIVKYNYSETNGVAIGYGNYVAIEHDNGVWSVYAHLNCWASGLAVGQRVKKGQIIGFVGNTGGSTGAHLHVEYRNGGFKGGVIDPLQDDATDFGLCTAPEEFKKQAENGNNSGAGAGGSGGSGGSGGTGGSSGTGGASSSESIEQNDHPDKDCTPLIFKEAYETCLFCNLFKVAFNTCSELAKKSFEVFAGPVANVVAIGMALWIAFTLLGFLSSLKVQEPKRFLRELLNQSFVVMIVYILLKSDSSTFMATFLEPIFNTGFKFARLTISGDFACPETDYGIIENGGLPASMGNSIICTIKTIQDKLTNILVIGDTSICVAFFVKNFFIFPHLGYLFAGLGLWVGGLAMLFIFPFMMLDAVLHMGVSCALLPAAIGAYAFNLTRKYVAKIWETFLHAMFQFIFLTIILIIICNSLEETLDGAVPPGTIESGDWKLVIKEMTWIGVAFLKVIFTLILGWVVLGQIASFAKSFAASISSTTEGRKIGGMGARAAKGIFDKGAKPILQKVGGEIATGVRNAGSSVKGFIAEQYQERKTQNYQDEDYRKRHGIVEGQDEDGNITYTRSTTSWFRRRPKQTTLTLANGKAVWSKSKQLSPNKKLVENTFNDIKQEEVYKNGEAVSRYSTFSNSRYQNLVQGDQLDTDMVAEIRNRYKDNLDLANETIMNQVFEQRMPNSMKRNFTLQNLKDAGKIEISKDGNGSEVMQITKLEDNGTKHIYQMITDKNGQVTTLYEQIKSNGKATVLRSNGIVNAKTFREYDKDGNVKKEGKTTYAVSARVTQNRSEVPVDSWGNLADYMPSKERLGLNQKEFEAFQKQFIYDRKNRKIAEFSD